MSETYDSILLSVSDKVDNVDPVAFRDNLISTINTCFAFCNQYGCGPEEGFQITTGEETWDDYVCKDITQKNLAKEYIGAKVKILFDPPQSGPMLQALERQITQLEWFITNCR